MKIENIISKSGYTIVKYYADWCGPCKAMNQTMHIVSEYPDINVVSINIDTEIELTKEFGITSVPTIAFYHNGDYMGRNVGAMNESMIMNVINGTTQLIK